jgi:DNA polymerase III delta prime subunit
MPVRSEIADRYETLDGKPGDLTWPIIDAFIDEMKTAHGARSSEYAHALALVARKARWTKTEGARGQKTMEEALDIVREDLRAANQVWWRQLLMLCCHQEKDGALAIRYANETAEHAVRANFSAEIIRGHKATAAVMLGWREPAVRVLEALQVGWADLTDAQRTTATNLLREIASFRADLGEDDKTLLRSVTDKAGGLREAFASLKPSSDMDALKGAMDELDRLTGLHGVKQQVRRMVAQLRVREARREAGLPVPEAVHHMAFMGPPGTGKTTVARLLGRIFKSLGILATDKLIETDRSGLVAQYVGQTAPRVNAKVDEAIGGVLFIDEAYALAPTSSNDFGHEAISTLLKRMEDDRHRLVVVLAGYADQMQTLLETNPGLRSRVPTIIDFRGYSGEELHKIMRGMFEHQAFTLSEAASTRGAELCHLLRTGADDRTFGNAREVRNIVDDTLAAQAVRLTRKMDLGVKPTKDELRRVEVADVTWSELGDPALDRLDPEHSEIVAVHEAGHALVRQLSGASRPVLVTIVPSGHALGRTFFADSDRQIVQRADLIAIAASALGGRAAEEEVYGAPSAGAIGDLGMAERILLHALKSGLSEDASDAALSEYVLSGASSSDTRSMSATARQEVAQMLAEAWTFARAAVKDHRPALDALTDALVAKRTVEGKELAALLPKAPERKVVKRRG